jgi:hypothetical protein
MEKPPQRATKWQQKLAVEFFSLQKSFLNAGQGKLKRNCCFKRKI